MTASYVEVPGTSAKLQTEKNTIGGVEVHAEDVVLVTPDGVAISSSNRLPVDASVSVTLGEVEIKNDSGNPVPIVGPVASGTSATGINPVLIAGNDTTNVRSIAVSSAGVAPGRVGVFFEQSSDADGISAIGKLAVPAHQNGTVSNGIQTLPLVFNGTTWDRQRGNTSGSFVQGPVANGAAVTGNPILASGSDGTNVRTVGIHQSGSTAAGTINLLMIGARDNSSAAQTLKVDMADSSGSLITATNLRNVNTLADGASNTPFIITKPITSEPGVNPTYGYVFNGTTWDRLRGNTTGIAISGTGNSIGDGLSETIAKTANRDATTIQTTPTMGLVFNGSAWDRMRGDTTGLFNHPAASPTTTGSTPYSNTALSNTKQTVKASSGRLYGYHLYNPNTSSVFVQFFDALAASVTVGTTTPTFVLTIPANATSPASLDMQLTVPISFTIGIVIAATTTATGSTAPATALNASLFYA